MHVIKHRGRHRCLRCHRYRRGVVAAATARRVLTDDTGSVSVEAALGMSALVVVVAAVVGALATLGAYLAAVDTAGAAARSLAIGVDFAPARGSVESSESGGLVTVIARVPAPLGEVSATAVFPQESQ